MKKYILFSSIKSIKPDKGLIYARIIIETKEGPMYYSTQSITTDGKGMHGVFEPHYNEHTTAGGAIIGE